MELGHIKIKMFSTNLIDSENSVIEADIETIHLLSLFSEDNICNMVGCLRRHDEDRSVYETKYIKTQTTENRRQVSSLQ